VLLGDVPGDLEASEIRLVLAAAIVGWVAVQPIYSHRAIRAVPELAHELDVAPVVLTGSIAPIDEPWLAGEWRLGHDISRGNYGPTAVLALLYAAARLTAYLAQALDPAVLEVTDGERVAFLVHQHAEARRTRKLGNTFAANAVRG